MSRPETGPMQFGDDWPGVFIRGDNAMYMAMMLRAVLDGAKLDPISLAAVEQLHSLLSGCRETPDQEGVVFLKPYDECLKDAEE